MNGRNISQRDLRNAMAAAIRSLAIDEWQERRVME